MTITARKLTIRDNSKIRDAIARHPIYWNTASDALRAMQYMLHVYGYVLADSWQDIVGKLDYERWERGETKTYTIPLVGYEHCLFISFYKMPVTGRYELTAYISL